EYEALHLIPEGLDVKGRLESFLAGAVLGFHDSESNQIFIVTSEKSMNIDRGVLAHELTHALTSRHYADAYASSSDFTDEILARLSVVEGDADFVESEYLTWCRTFAGEKCPLTVDTGAAVGPGIPQGILLIELFPYTVGSRFMQGLYKENGWSAVNEAYENLPTSTEQIIHPEKYLADLPKRVLIEDLQPSGWEIVGVDILGEASMYAMFSNRGVVRSMLQQDFKSVYTDGWGGDKMLVLRKGSSYGYIWRTLWDTPADADEFASGYELLLKSLGAEKRATYWKIDADDYVFIDRQLLYVTIVNGPSEAALSELYPPLASLPVRLERVEIVDHRGSTVESIASGEPMSIRISAVNEEDETFDFSSLIHIRNESGQSMFTSVVTSTVDSNHVFSYEVGWTPLATGKYTVEVVTWRSLSDPTPLSAPLLTNVTVSK
ncbi:MAG: Hvo_1808 family surface protein, partial [Candidatus Bathyarchaeia archaeon]